MKKRICVTIGLAVLFLGAGSRVALADLTFQGSSGNLAASAVFSLTGSTLTVTLANTSTHDVLVPTDVLTGVFFNTTHKLTPVSASLNGSSVYYGTLTNAGDGWGYASGVAAQGFNSAVSATGAVSGLGHSNFSAVNNALDGLAYGILSKGDDTTTDNGGIHGPLIKYSVKFTLTADQGFSLNELGRKIEFQYGTALDETHYGGNKVPDGGVTLMLLGGALVGIETIHRKLRA